MTDTTTKTALAVAAALRGGDANAVADLIERINGINVHAANAKLALERGEEVVASWHNAKAVKATEATEL